VIKNFLFRSWYSLLLLVLFAVYILIHKELIVEYHCPFHAVTGLYCPGCGGLRALNSLANADFMAALQYNPLIVIMLPLLLLGMNNRMREKIITTEVIKTKVPLIVLVAVITFGILRNVFLL